MKPKEMSITVSRTVNLGNFESLRVEAGMAASVDNGDDLEDTRSKIIAEIRRSLSAAYKANVPPKEG